MQHTAKQLASSLRLMRFGLGLAMIASLGLASHRALAAAAMAEPTTASTAAQAVSMVKVNGLDFPVLDIGKGPAVLLLHGFPDSHAVWRKQIDPLVAAGFRVIAPDLRGFGDAPRPEGVAEYGLSKSVGDMVGLLNALNIDKANVIGHDWGAALAWGLAQYQPERVAKLAVLSVGAPGTGAFDTIEQREKSWYFNFFQFEGVAEANLKQNDWALFRQLMRNEGDVDAAVRNFSRPGALTAGLNWYRANLKPSLRDLTPHPSPKVKCATLGIWSDGDHYLTEAQMQASAQVAANWRYEKMNGAGHWMMLEQPERLNRLLVGFLTN
ncbi:alpha/beta fold hydrolase [Chitinimonas sp.]|uniref:alpha/beta fold hydrolase n=1 Tax=Chitinimonas sp. TaxID=1934313 RepID=UPI0035B3B465